MKPLTVVLVLLLGLVQAGLWLGDGGLPTARHMRTQLEALQRQNAEARRDNERLAAEVQDLRQGLEMVEERARFELGMVKPDELYVQYTARP